MTSLFGVHWIPEHRGPEDKARFAQWRPPFVKVVCIDEKPPYMEDMPAGAQIVIRNHPMSENYGSRDLRSLDDARRIGDQHAAACLRMADYCVGRGMARDRLLFEGLNEPQVWTDAESPERVAAYYAAFLQGLHNYGLHGVVLNFGVGWPGNGGIKDAPPIWAPLTPVYLAMATGDYLGLHEYWDMAGPGENWRWWAGRYLQCSWRVPILITECGVDRGVAGAQGGWIDLPGNTIDAKADRYVADLADYEARLRGDGRVHGALIFTYDQSGADWQRFSIRNDVLMPRLLAYIQAQAAPAPTPTPEPPPAPVPDPEPAPSSVAQLFVLRRPLANGIGAVSQWFGANPANYAAYDLAGHEGLDYGVPVGTQVLAAQAGKVAISNVGVYGLRITIANERLSTVYAHLSATRVQAGMTVKAGDCIGLSGDSGRSEGAHLHFGCRVAGVRNPAYQDFIDPVLLRKLNGDA